MSNILLLFEALSPITHNSTSEGNTQFVNREPLLYNGAVRKVPVISGNSLRHILFREPLADHIAEGSQFSKEQVRWLFNGGALAGSHPNIDTKRIRLGEELLPVTEMVGCSYPDTIHAGKVNQQFAWLVCRESARVLRSILRWFGREDLGEAFPDNAMIPADSLTSERQYYRHDGAIQRQMKLVSNDLIGPKSGSLLDDEFSPIEGPSNACMPHSGETVITGALFLGGLRAHGLSELGQSALAFALDWWSKHNGHVGGQASRGHGRVKLTAWSDMTVGPELYQEHVESRKPEIIDFIRRLYISKKGDDTEGAKGGKPKSKR